MEDKFWELCTLYFSNEASVEEENQLVDILQASKENQKRFDEMACQWNLTGKVSHTFFNSIKAKAKISIAIGSSGKKPVLKIHKNILIKVTATLLVFASIGWAINITAFNSDKWVEYSTESNQHLKVKLPDNSVVWLNGNSTLAFNFSAKNVRKTRLNGEAFFEVARDTLRPFIVQTNHLITKVLGTSFNINSREMEEVSVISGKVVVTSDSNKSVLLTQGEQANFNTSFNRLAKTKIPNILNTIAWKDEVLVFDNTTLENALIQLGRAYNVTFIYENKNIKNCKIRASFNGRSLQSILNIICTSVNCSYLLNKEEKLIIITGEGC